MEGTDWAGTVWAALVSTVERQQGAWAAVAAAHERSGSGSPTFREAVVRWGTACGVGADLAQTVADLCGPGHV